MITFAGIDGTSAAVGTEEIPGPYQKEFRNSFVRQLSENRLVEFSDPWYLRGPFTSGSDTAERANACYGNVKALWTKGSAKAIFLGGFSRGAAAVLEVAKWLKYRDNIPVECLILFDPVDRSYTIGEPTPWNTEIPSNVKRVIQPVRNVWTTHSRISFGTCGVWRESSGTIRFWDLFRATHGGLGGTPWEKATHPITGLPYPTIWEFGEFTPTLVTPSADCAGSAQVWAWAKSHIAFAFYECQKRLEREAAAKPDPGVKTPESGMPGGGVGGHVPERGHDGREKRYYIVQSGDWLSKIAEKYYGDAMKYKPLHRANASVIGPDPNKIEPRQRLWIPYPDELSKFN